MLVDRDRKTLLRFILPDDILIQERFDVLRLRQICRRRSAFRLLFVIDYLVADINSLIAKVNARAGDQFLDVILRLAAKGTAKKFFRSAEICHKKFANFEMRFSIGSQFSAK
jgi:hypothetical protein